MTKPVHIAVAGLGNVGGEVAKRLVKYAARYAAAGAPSRLVAVASRHAARAAKRLGLPSRVRRFTDPLELAETDADVIVELIGGYATAKRLALRSLRSGKDFVTGNKHLISTAWPELSKTAGKHGRSLRFEAAVAGGIPIVESLQTGLAANKISSVVGIFNGTTNYILTRMAHDKCSLKDALLEAQRLGMAERDASLDLSGGDTAHKTAIVASMISGSWVNPNQIRTVGIEPIRFEDLDFAVRRLDRTVRLLGTAASRDKAVEAHVQPTLVPLDHPLAAVHGGYNAALVDAEPVGDLMFYGLGAGPGPAASAALADVLKTVRERSAGATPFIPPSLKNSSRPLLEEASKYYIRLDVRDIPGALSRITGELGRARISISSLHQEAPSRHSVPVMIVTHETERERLDLALKRIARLSAVRGSGLALRLWPR